MWSNNLDHQLKLKMCSHYEPVTDSSRLNAFFGVATGTLSFKNQLWPGLMGPFIRLSAGEPSVEMLPSRELRAGAFGLIPVWSKDAMISRRTYNARSETVHEKPSYRDAWRLARHCIIPAEAIYEPDWRNGKAVATRISRTDGRPMGIAGLWACWRQPDGEVLLSYTMLTINADDHSVMRNFHKPGEEKRMVVVLDDSDYDAWLSVPAASSKDYLRQFPADSLSFSILSRPRDKEAPP